MHLPTSGAVTGAVRWLLRVEGLALLIGITILYAHQSGSWWLYAGLFFLPDLGFLAYLAGPRIGAAGYNILHSYMLPLVILIAGYSAAQPLLVSIGMIWLAHIGFDRALGYGLKYGAGFTFTHLGRIGKDAAG